MAEQPSGIDVMRRRIERASRQAPPSRHPASETAPVAPAAAPEPETPAPEPETPPPARAPRRPRPRGVGEAAGPRLAPDLPPVNLAIRVRKPLDDALADTIHALRGQGVRTSKVELIEMLLWESATAQPEAVRARLRVFREWAPRGASARLEG